MVRDDAVSEILIIAPASRILPKYWPIIMPLSGLPKILIVITNGNVRSKDRQQKDQAAKNLPQTRFSIETGKVVNCNMVPFLNSSDHRRMDIPGIKIKNIQGIILNIGVREAFPDEKISPKYKDKEPFNRRKQIK